MSFVGKWFGFGKDAAFDDGVRAYEQREFGAALERFRESVVGAHDFAVRERAKSYVAGCLGKLAREAAGRRDFEETKRLFGEAVELRPGFADLWLGLAQAHRSEGDLDLAWGAVGRALEINPQYGAALVTRGSLEYRRGHRAEGLETMREGVIYDSRLDGDEWKSGLAADSTGDFDRAYLEFCSMKPSGGDVNDILAAGDALAKKGEWLKAEQMYRSALEIAPAYADVRVRHGQALMELGELSSAASAFQRAVALNPGYAEAYALLGVVLRRQGDEENALTAFRRALEVDPHHPIASQEVLYRRV